MSLWQCLLIDSNRLLWRNTTVPLADVTHLWTVTVVERSLQEALGSWFIFPWGQLCQAWNTNKQGKIFQNSYMMTGCTASWHVMAGNSGILMIALKGRSCHHPQLLEHLMGLEHHVFFLPWQVQMSAVFIVAALSSYYSVLEDMVTRQPLLSWSFKPTFRLYRVTSPYRA